MNRTATIGAAMLWLIGCNSAPAPDTDAAMERQSGELQAVTFYLEGMNERLKIL